MLSVILGKDRRIFPFSTAREVAAGEIVSEMAYLSTFEYKANKSRSIRLQNIKSQRISYDDMCWIADGNHLFSKNSLAHCLTHRFEIRRDHGDAIFQNLLHGGVVIRDQSNVRPQFVVFAAR